MTRKKIKLIAFLWHRRIGLAAIILIMTLAITGIMLNHTDGLQLNDRYIESATLLNWYGLEPDGDMVSYKINSHIVSFWGGKLFFDKQMITSAVEKLHGVVWAEQLIIAAFETEIILLSHEGELVERIPTNQIFPNIRRLGLKYGRPVIETGESLYYMADEHILDWDLTSDEDIQWSVKTQLKKSQINDLRTVFRGKGLNMERVILDLHSGRVFGRYGIYLMDAAAIALLWLSFSGLWVWWQRRVKQKKKRHFRKHH